MGCCVKSIEKMLLFPVRCCLYVLGALFNGCGRVCSLGEDKSHLGGDHSMYNAMMVSGPNECPMEMIEIKCEIRKIKFFDMKLNCNVVCSTGDFRRQHIVAQITHIVEGGKGEKLGLMEEDIIMGVHDVHGSHVIKPSSDAVKHLEKIMLASDKVRELLAYFGRYYFSF